jgi:asparagine synthase (glutamine-hydrolysing)
MRYMCGIAGIVNLSGGRAVPSGMLRPMADAILHRGPDDEGYFEAGGIGLASRRLSIVGLADGHQPLANEDGSVLTVFNGELFDYPEMKAALESKGHHFATHCDTELIPHLWEDRQEGMFERLRGQFALAIYDQRRRRLVLARDRFGICPLFWTRQTSPDGDWLLFGSEIKALLASGMVTASPDVKGIDQVFHFFAVPGPSTCFEGVQALQPGHYLVIDLAVADKQPLEPRPYWTMTFPDAGDEDRHDATNAAVDQFEKVLVSAVERRLRADVPVVCYLSGGIDSSLVSAMAARLRGTPTPTFTVQITRRGFDETSQAAMVARHIGAHPVVVPVSDADVLNTYPELIGAAEAPVIDTAAAATLMLAREVHRCGFKVALTGEGSDEWLAGYAWHKVHRLINFADVIPGLRLSGTVRRLLCDVVGVPARGRQRILGSPEILGHHSAFHDVYGLMTASRFLFYNQDMLASLEDHNPYLELRPDLESMARWHSINQSAYWASRIHLPGHLLSLKGDRAAMHSSVETRYPFLDEEMFAFLAALHPNWKLRGFRDKYILRLVGERYLPPEIAWRRKFMFRTPMEHFSNSGGSNVPAYVGQLLSEDALRKTGWFNVSAVQYWQRRIRAGDLHRGQRTMVQLGMVGVVASQLWYHTFIAGLADLPSWDTSGWATLQRDVAAARILQSQPAINPV